MFGCCSSESSFPILLSTICCKVSIFSTQKFGFVLLLCSLISYGGKLPYINIRVTFIQDIEAHMHKTLVLLSALLSVCFIYSSVGVMLLFFFSHSLVFFLINILFMPPTAFRHVYIVGCIV